MIRRISIFSFLFALLLVLGACTNTDSTENGADEPKPSAPEVNEEVTGEDDIEDESDAEEEVNEPNDPVIEDDDGNDDPVEPQFVTAEEISAHLVEALANENMDDVAQYVHPDKGLLFSPYVYITDDLVIVDQEDLADLLASNDVFTWGIYDGKGTPIELTPAAYFDEFLEMDPFENPDDILVNDLQQRGNMIHNINDKYPNATVVEYYHEGSAEFAGIDWASLLFIFENDANGDLKLVALIRDLWTT